MVFTIDTTAATAHQAITTNTVMSEHTFEVICTTMAQDETGYPNLGEGAQRTANAGLLLFKLANLLADIGTSAKTDLTPFTIAFTGAGAPINYPATQVATLVMQRCTLRQFASFFAATVFDWRLRNNTPPAKWQVWGYTEDTKYMAFDFSNAITAPSIAQPANGMLRWPTEIETQAGLTAMRVKIHRSTMEAAGGYTSNDTLVTQGRTRPSSQLQLPPPP